MKPLVSKRQAFALALLFGAAGAQGAQPSAAALALHQRLLVLDSHLDTPRLLALPGWDIRQRHDSRRELSQVDLPRLREGGLDGGFWAIYTAQGPRDAAGRNAASSQGLATLLRIRDLVERHPQDLGLALDAADARRLQGEGRHAVFISMENAQPLASDPALLATYQRQGLRMLGLVHGSNNDLADSATALPEWGGLSPAGQALVAQANCLGILLDASHASDQVFDQLLERSQAPIVLSHSSSRAVNAHPRNLDDARIRRLAERGGVIQVTLYGDYLQPQAADPRRQAALQPLYGRLRQMAGLAPGEFAELAREMAEVEQRYPRPRATLDDFMAHLLHVIEVAGIGHVGIGGDWDGGGGVEGLDDVAGLPRITERLLQAGYDETQIAAIWGGNLLRLLDEVQTRTGTNCPAP
ncbi:dipeptidase [Stutzerimonas kirkiae]|uniref:dipeptidase n=1 Tax=Stutzerimonas kirkiae TaxID=2211392 RepID=UPI0010385B0C|nr:dipeptidase [Stutzerimonas kirkiae]TBV10950.1 peptidase M19 [Stutzerimonas kirkiae]